MDFKELMRIANENKQKAKKVCAETKRYDTKVPPPKKEQKTVDPNAIRARLFQKEHALKEKAAEEARKKEELLILRAASGKKFRAKSRIDLDSLTPRSNNDRPDTNGESSRRSRNNSGYEDEDHEIRHKTFMDKISKNAQKSREVVDISDSESESSEYETDSSSEDEAPASKVPDKKKKKSAAPMSFNEIMKLAAQKAKGGPSNNVEKPPDSLSRTIKSMPSFNKKHKDKNDKLKVIGNGDIKEAAEKYKAKSKDSKSSNVPSSTQKEEVKKSSISNGKIKEAAEKYKSKSSKLESNSAQKSSRERIIDEKVKSNNSSQQDRDSKRAEMSKSSKTSSAPERNSVKLKQSASKTDSKVSREKFHRSEDQPPNKKAKMASNGVRDRHDTDKKKMSSETERKKQQAAAKMRQDKERPLSDMEKKKQKALDKMRREKDEAQKALAKMRREKEEAEKALAKMRKEKEEAEIEKKKQKAKADVRQWQRSRDEETLTEMEKKKRKALAIMHQKDGSDRPLTEKEKRDQKAFAAMRQLRKDGHTSDRPPPEMEKKKQKASAAMRRDDRSDRPLTEKEKKKKAALAAMRHQERSRERPHASHMDGEFRRPKKRSAEPPRLKAQYGRIVSDDEDSDYEDDGFIDDTPVGEGGGDVSSYIKEIFGYDKSKYGYESDYALRFMDASYGEIQKEEARSARLGMLEDLEDMRMEKEEEMRKAKRRSKAKGKR